MDVELLADERLDLGIVSSLPWYLTDVFATKHVAFAYAVPVACIKALLPVHVRSCLLILLVLWSVHVLAGNFFRWQLYSFIMLFNKSESAFAI